MSLVQCKLGYAEPIIFGHTYVFNRDRFNRYVCRVDEEKHRTVLLAVEHYVLAPETPEDAVTLVPEKEVDVAAVSELLGLGDASQQAPPPAADEPPAPPADPAKAQEPKDAADHEPVTDPVMTDIKGIGPSTASKLAEAGFIEVKQIAALTEEDATALDGLLKLKGAIARDAWIAQAKALIGE